VIAQNADTSKMNLRNLGIVFSPTLAIPAPLFALFLLEFDVSEGALQLFRIERMLIPLRHVTTARFRSRERNWERQTHHGR
jgi:hypothetical protein